jgi:hypothetical protein
MEVSELMSYYINDISNTLDVSFKLVGDEDEFMRVDEIDLTEVETFGYKLKDEIDIDLFDGYEEEINYEDETITFDKNDSEFNHYEVITFLNQYYLIYPENLPNSELF